MQAMDETDITTIERICASVLDKVPVQPTATPDSPRSSELNNFARSLVTSMRRIPEEQWNHVKTDIMLVVRNLSAPAPPVLPVLKSSYDPNPILGYNAHNTLRHASPSYGYYRAPSATSQSQYLQQPSIQFLPQMPPAAQQGPQYMQQVVPTKTISNISNTVTTATTAAADTLVNDDFLNYVDNNLSCLL